MNNSNRIAIWQYQLSNNMKLIYQSVQNAKYANEVQPKTAPRLTNCSKCTSILPKNKSFQVHLSNTHGVNQNSNMSNFWTSK